ncbi:LysR family transcriptional regulator [Dongia sp.]|uniref:LysR family transcriptional regulator n=1 Tax=Dongia sp. TaxID=1977262 RepID=UPI0035B24CE1
MTQPDLNLLITLDVLLREGSVAGAAKRLQLSPSAMSRQLARLRETVGDPLLVRAGRGLVPTPRALELKSEVGPLLAAAGHMLRPVDRLDLKRLDRRFTIRSRDGFVENFGPALLARIGREAPGVTLSFVPKTDRDSAPLRDGSIDLETGVLAESLSPELMSVHLFRDRFVGVVRKSHALARGRMTPQLFAAARHILITRRDETRGRVDEDLDEHGLTRNIATVVGSFTAALALTRHTDLVATVPERHTGNLRQGLVSFDLPVKLPPFTVSLLWHPRQDADPAHRWLRGCVREVCAA